MSFCLSEAPSDIFKAINKTHELLLDKCFYGLSKGYHRQGGYALEAFKIVKSSLYHVTVDLTVKLDQCKIWR